MDYILKKSLGQHFLTDESISKKIVETVAACGITNIAEVGPGGGAITKYFLKLPNIKFKAIEFDREKVAFLLKTYPAITDKLIQADFLNTDLPFDNDFLLAGNFPYNISSQIVFKMLEWRNNIPVCIGMFQKEVAQRLAAKHGNKTYGILSVLVGAYYTIDYLFDVPPTAFNPPPKVMSGVIKMIRMAEPITMASDRRLLVLVKTAFNQRRKTLRNAVKSLFSAEELINPIFDKRAEQLSVEEFGLLTFKMQ